MPGAPTILVAEDDIADVLLLRTAARQAGIRSELRFVSDGVELLDYLTREGAYAARNDGDPYLVLLDLNMPRMDGKSALKEIRVTAESRALPVVVLSTTDRATEIRECLDAGANSFVTKPIDIDALATLLVDLERYWLDVVARPS